MVEQTDSRKKTKYVACFIILWLLQMAAAFWFCTRKQGFHEDEFYTYYIHRADKRVLCGGREVDGAGRIPQ